MSPFSDMTSATEDLVWRALADPVRRRILDQLVAAPLTTGQIVDGVDGLCRTAVMKHLDILVSADLVVVRREGRFRWNHLNPVPIERVCSRWVSQHVRKLTSAVKRLKTVVESTDF